MKTLSLVCSVLLFVSCKKEAPEVSDMAVSEATYAACASVDTVAVEAVDTATAQSYNMSVDKDSKDMNVPAKEDSSPEGEQAEQTIESKIIKSGNLRYQTDDLDKTYNQIQAAVKKYKAIVKNDSQSNGDYQFTRSINVRIPNENFDAFINEISKGVSYFDQKDISSQDVTEEYIDVASRIKTKKVLEERYFELLKKANKVSEMLEIEKQLSEIREEIEAKEGRLKYLQNKVAMSTLDIEFYKPIAQGRKATVSYGGRIGNAIISGFNGISNFFIGLLGIWPVIVTLVALFILIRKRFKRKNKKDAIEN